MKWGYKEIPIMFLGILENKIETKQSFYEHSDLFASMLDNKLEYSIILY